MLITVMSLWYKIRQLRLSLPLKFYSEIVSRGRTQGATGILEVQCFFITKIREREGEIDFCLLAFSSSLLSLFACLLLLFFLFSLSLRVFFLGSDCLQFLFFCLSSISFYLQFFFFLSLSSFFLLFSFSSSAEPFPFFFFFSALSPLKLHPSSDITVR